MEDGLRNKVEQFKAIAEELLKNDIRAFIKDIYNNYYFADILFVGEDGLRIQCFGPEQRKGLKETLLWSTISFIFKYKEETK